MHKNKPSSLRQLSLFQHFKFDCYTYLGIFFENGLKYFSSSKRFLPGKEVVSITRAANMLRLFILLLLVWLLLMDLIIMSGIKMIG